MVCYVGRVSVRGERRKQDKRSQTQRKSSERRERDAGCNVSDGGGGDATDSPGAAAGSESTWAAGWGPARSPAPRASAA